MKVCPLAPLGLALWAAAAQAADSAVRVDLVSEVRQCVPGTQVWIGVRFQVAPGWHIYWENPGDNGMAPTVNWRLPEGFQVSALQWPEPRRFGEAPSISYGCEGDVLLLAQLTTATSPPPSGVVKIGARVKWLACREACVPGRAELELSLGAGAVSLPDDRSAGRIARALAARPEAAGARVRAFAEGKAMILAAELPPDRTAPATAYFFSAEPERVDHSAPQEWLPGAPGRRLRIPLSPYRSEPPARLRGILRVEYPTPICWSVDVPVEQGNRGDRE